jgi:hypothetical protein
MHAIAAIESMEYRNERLNARYLDSIINGPKKNLLIGEIIHYQLSIIDPENTSIQLEDSIIGSFFNCNSFSSLIKDNLMPSDERWKEFKERNIYGFIVDGIAQNKSGCKRLDTNNRPGRRDLLLLPLNCVLIPRKVVYTFLQWKLGRFSTHLQCRICYNAQATTNHILSCSTNIDNVSFESQIISLLQIRMKKRRIEDVVSLIDRSISYLAHCNTHLDRELLIKLANLLDLARLQSLDKAIAVEPEVEADELDFYSEALISLKNQRKHRTHKRYGLGY